jgi:hypothetical protein
VVQCYIRYFVVVVIIIVVAAIVEVEVDSGQKRKES